ncbi:MAG TPA: Ku protein [Tepidisphaeraceae bacterium]|nr:Ku protein [Tepidisphaeraceae bacterium]
MARRAIWSGSISFGLVNIPIKMYTATREHEIRFNMLHDQDRARLRRKLVSESTGKEVHPEHIIKGYEFAKNQYVVVQKEELESCAPEKSKAIEITDFVNLAEIGPIYYEKPYYLAPQSAPAGKPYRLLVEAMNKSQKVGIAKMVMHEKEHLVALRPLGDALCLEMMKFADEVVGLDEIDGIPTDVKVGERELKAAIQLVESLSTKFDPEKYHDEYRDCVMKLIHRKAKGEEIHIAPAADKKVGRATDLMAALEASLAQAKSGASSSAANGQGRRRRKSA